MRKPLFFLLAFLYSCQLFCQIKSLQEQCLDSIRSGKYKLTFEVINSIEKINAVSAETLLPSKLFCFYKLKDHRKAQETLQQIEDLDIHNTETTVLKLYYLYRARQAEEATELSLEMVERKPEAFCQKLKILAKDDINIISNYISNYLKNIDEEETAEYKTAVGLMYFAADNLPESYNQLSSAIEDNPQPYSYYVMGRIKTYQKEYIPSISYYNNAERLGYKTYDLYKDRSIAKGFDLDFQGAIQDLDSCLKIRRSDEAYCLRAICYIHLLQYDKAMLDINAALALNDTVAQYHNQKGIIYTNVGKYAEAVLAFQTAIELDPKLNYIHNNLGIALEKSGFVEEAVKHYNINQERHPYHADTYFNLGRIAYNEGKYKKAIKLLLQANDLNPRYSDTQYYLGLAYIKSEKPEEGCFYLKMALENFDPKAQEAIDLYCQPKPLEQVEETEEGEKKGFFDFFKRKKKAEESEQEEQEDEYQDPESEDYYEEEEEPYSDEEEYTD